MSFSKPPVVASALAVAAALSLVPMDGWARDGRRSGEDVVYEIAPMSREASQDIIFEMPPMRPVKKSATAAAPKPAPAPAAEVAKSAEPGKSGETAKPAEPANGSEVAKAAEPAQAVDAARAVEPANAPEASKTAEASPDAKPAEPIQPAAEAAAAADAPPPNPEAAPAPADAVAEAAAPAEPLNAAAPPPAEAQVAAEAPASGETGKPETEAQAVEAQTLAEAAPPVEASQPVAAAVPAPAIMTANPPQKSLVAGPPAAAKLELPQEQSQPAAFAFAPAPFGKPFWQAAAIPNPAASAKPASQSAESPAPAAETAVETGTAEAPTEAAAPPEANDGSVAEAAPVDPAQEEAAAAARIAALFATGVKGPAEVRVADRATLWLPAGRVFIPQEAARKLAVEAGVELRPTAQGLIALGVDKLEWLAPVELLDDGYIKTDNAEALDPDKLLAAFEAGLPEANAQRMSAGQPPVTLGGWLSPPKLDDKHRLSACVTIATQNDPNGADRFFNCEAWALGRHGAIKISLADGGEQAEKLKGEAAALADLIVFDRGMAYEDVDLAADKVAPYAAADMLTSDVSAKAVTPPVVPTETTAGAPVLLILVEKLWKIVLFAVAGIVGVFAWMKRRNRPAPEDARVEPIPAPVEPRAKPAAKPSPAKAGAQQVSLFARLLPTLHARFAAKRGKPDTAPTTATKPDVEVIDVDTVAAPKTSRVQSKPAGGGLLGKIASLRSAGKSVDVKPAPTAAARKADAANDAEEPVSALKKLAMKMKRSTPEPQAPPVDVSRALRATRTLPGAAPALAEALVVEPEQVDAAPIVAKAPASPAMQAPAEDDIIGLVEPGDEAAASAAINASRALREAQG